MSELDREKKIIRFTCVNLFILFFSVYLLTAPGMNFFDIDASQMRIQVAKSIVERADISVAEGVGIIGDDGRKYSWLGIGTTIIAIPFYIIGKSIGIPEFAILIMNLLFGAAAPIIIFLFCISLGYSRRTSFLVSIFYGFGTMAWPLAKQPFDHTIETFLILLSVYFMYSYVIHRKISRLLFSSIALGFAFITRATSVLVMPPLFILMIISLSKQSDFKATLKLMTKNIVLLSLTLLPFLCLFFWYNYYRFGSVLETGYQLMSTSTGIDYFSKTSIFTGLNGLLISPGKGIFYYSPIAILFFISIKSFMKKHLWLSVSFILIMLSYVLFYSKYIYWHGDFAWGPRYLLVITPFLIIPIAELLESRIWSKKKLLRVAICLIFILALIIQIAAVSVDFQKYFINLIIDQKITVIQGRGVPLIFVPPDETYFNWYKSPLLTQFKFIYEMTKNMKCIKYSEKLGNETVCEKIYTEPSLNIFDFWWVYMYFEDASYSVLLMALILLFIAIYYAGRAWKFSSRGYKCQN
jgi:hypothetical protein